MFQLLEDEGFTIPQHLKYFPYRSTFDMESMFSSTTGLKNTEKLSLDAKHIPLSVRVCSNIPDFDQTQFFVSEGDSTQLVTDKVDYLIEISKQSYRLMKQEFAILFEAIDEKLEEKRNDTPPMQGPQLSAKEEKGSRKIATTKAKI